jgi:hypothetical protein
LTHKKNEPLRLERAKKQKEKSIEKSADRKSTDSRAFVKTKSKLASSET